MPDPGITTIVLAWVALVLTIAYILIRLDSQCK